MAKYDMNDVFWCTVHIRVLVYIHKSSNLYIRYEEIIKGVVHYINKHATCMSCF